MPMREAPLNGRSSETDAVLAPLTESRFQDFHALLLYQAQCHASEEHIKRQNHGNELFKAMVEEKKAEAFLLVSPQSGVTVAAVTYYDNLRGVHLEDIVALPKAVGAGGRAMAGMAQVALQRRAEAVVWECAEDNRALRFYERLGGVHETDRCVWRLHGPIKAQASIISVREQFMFNAQNVTQPVSGESMHVPAPKLQKFHVTAHHANNAAENSIVGEMHVTRSFSTFRVEDAMHIEAVHASAPEVLMGLLERAGESQRRNGWHGHTDITVHKEQEEMLRPVLQRYGFAPMTYGTSRMLSFSLSGQALKDLADRPQRDLLVDLTLSTASRPHQPISGNGHPQHNR